VERERSKKMKSLTAFQTTGGKISLSDTLIRTAFTEWLDDKVDDLEKYGPIAFRNTSDVSGMKSLFDDYDDRQAMIDKL
jgi:hypothetical protein